MDAVQSIGSGQIILGRREMGKISELKEQKSHRAANDGLEQRGERRKVGKEE